jgi:Cu+-exporting ATPase
MAAAGTAGLATIGVATAGERRTVTYLVKGFSCVTCAAGLETMLRQKNGVIRVEASYPKATAVIEYDPSLIAEEQLRAFITDMGFTAEKDGAHGRA